MISDFFVAEKDTPVNAEEICLRRKNKGKKFYHLPVTFSFVRRCTDKPAYMKQLLTTILAATLMFTASAQKVINDPNVEVRSVGSFTALDVSNAFEVIITQGNEETVAVSSNIEGDNKNIITETKNGRLKISYQQQGKRWYKNHRLKAYVSVKNIEGIKGSGATKFIIEGTLAATKLNIDLSGATDMKGKVTVNQELQLNLSGASDVTLTGAAGSIAIDASGASDVKAFDLTAGNCTIKASGACNIRISAEKEISAQLSGASNVQYQGSAMIRDIKTSGASNISRKS